MTLSTPGGYEALRGSAMRGNGHCTRGLYIEIVQPARLKFVPKREDFLKLLIPRCEAGYFEYFLIKSAASAY
jgi:hypothetical protein